jgi:hypothetical protein
VYERDIRDRNHVGVLAERVQFQVQHQLRIAVQAKQRINTQTPLVVQGQRRLAQIGSDSARKPLQKGQEVRHNRADLGFIPILPADIRELLTQETHGVQWLSHQKLVKQTMQIRWLRHGDPFLFPVWINETS